MGLFTDTVTLYHKVSEGEWKRYLIEGVQWSEKNERKIVNGTLCVVPFILITFPEGTYETLPLDIYGTEDCIVYGNVDDMVDGSRGKRISDLMEKYAKSGLIKSVNDNSLRNHLRSMKVVIG